mgnify:FL=1|tara:strand:- start:19 stop:219 length:201 start_codon:yes stop_codon:yes gene_type:complete
MKETSEEERLANQRIELVNDLIACETVMDEIWKFHPDNPKKKDVVSEYEILQQVSKGLREELENLR